MTSEVSTVGPPHTLLQVNGSFVNDASDKTEPPLPSDVVIQRRSQLGVPSLCQLDITSPVRYGVLIGNMIWMPAAWLHLLQWMLPLTQGTEPHWNGAGSARLDERHLTTAPHNTGAELLLRDAHTSPAFSSAGSSPVHQFNTPAPHIVHGAQGWSTWGG